MNDGVSRLARPLGRLWHRLVADLMDGLRLGPVRCGLLATTLLALGSLTPAYLPQSSPYWPMARELGLDSLWAKGAGTVMVIAGIGLLIVAWFSLRATVYLHVKHWVVLAWWSLPLLFAPPIMSHDAYSYAAQGWLIHNGFNPYAASPSYLPGPFADQVAWMWRYTPAPYGPLALQLSHGLVELAGLNPYYSAVLHRIPALVGVGLIAHFLPRLARQLGIDPRPVAWFSVINPLVVVDFVGGCHNDALMMGLIVVALYFGSRGFTLWGLVTLGVAASIKQPAFLAIAPLAVMGSGWSSWHPRAVLRFVPRALYAIAVSVGVFAGISVASGLGFGWLNAVSVPGSIPSPAPLSLLGWCVQQGVNVAAGTPDATWLWRGAQLLGVIACVIVMVWLALRFLRTRPLTFLAWGYLAFAVLAPALNPWYLTWGGLLLPLTRPGPRIWRAAAGTVAVILVYAAGNLAWRNSVVGLALAAMVAAGIVLYRRRQEGHWPLTGVGHDAHDWHDDEH